MPQLEPYTKYEKYSLYVQYLADIDGHLKHLNRAQVSSKIMETTWSRSITLHVARAEKLYFLKEKSN